MKCTSLASLLSPRRLPAVVCSPLLMLAALPVVKAAPSPAREWNEQLMTSIRLNVPNPPAHARNLFHTAVAMYNAWAAFDTTAVGYLYNEKAAVIPSTRSELNEARRAAISCAAYRILKKRFETGPDPVKQAQIHAGLDNRLTGMGYSTTMALSALTADPSPAELGKRVGQAILDWGDGFSLTGYPQAYNSAVNPNMAVPLSVLGDNFEDPPRPNMPLGHGIPAATNPNYWQPLSLSVVVDQSGNILPGGTQTFVGVQGLATTPFSLTRTDASKPWIDPFGGPSRLSTPGNPSPTDAAYKDNFMDVLRKSAKLNDETPVDRSPGANGNNPPGTDTGTGHPLNPVTGETYEPNPVKPSDYYRVLAEFWADGPNSETPPGHWHVLANEVADDPQLVKKIRGAGPVLDDLEWDVKVYFALSAATHDAACAAWSLKRYYSGTRPITAIRYMGSKGQSSHPAGPSYHEQGLPLEEGVVEVITASTTGPGGKHAQMWDVSTNAYVPGSLLIGQIAVYSWPGEHPQNLPAPSIATHQSLVRWQLAKDWLPFQRKTFNTPAFPGYVSGHSTFSRAAAEALTLLTGSPYFPGGFGHHTVLANSMQIDLGPSEDVDLQWCTYYDAADEAGQSRRWGGIHPYEDDYHGRRIGSIVGKSAFVLAEKYWTGAILASEAVAPALAYQPGGSAVLTWTPTRGMYHKVQTSTSLTGPDGWSDATVAALYRDNDAIAGNPAATYTDFSPEPGRKFYRVVRSFPPQG
jgi:hypothetical protein